VRAAFPVRNLALLSLKPFCAFNTVELPKTWEILYCLRALVLLKVLGRTEIFLDLIYVPGEDLAQKIIEQHLGFYLNLLLVLVFVDF